MVKLNIDYTHEYAEDILEYIGDKCPIKDYDLTDITLTEEGTDDVKIMAYYGEYNFEFNDIPYIVKYYPEGDIISCPHGPDNKRCIYIECCHHKEDKENIGAIKNLLIHIKKSSKPELENSIRIFISTNNKWDKLSVIQKRPMETVFINKKDDVLSDINKFMISENIYIKNGIKYKRNYLFHGPPGTGKTSFITAIASKYNLDIFMVNFGGGITDSSFIKIISRIPEKSLLVLEDIDSLFSNDLENKTNVSFSTILNTLDGFACKNRLITIMTTNHINKLNGALIRPGRIDYIFELTYANRDQMYEMYSSYFPDKDIFSTLYETIKSKKISTAAFHKFLFDNRDTSNIMDNIEVLYTLTEQYKSYQNMYL